MEARLHYSRPLLLQLESPASAPATAGGAVVPDARSVPAPDSFDFLNDNTILVLAALLVYGLVAALALRAVLQCALRVTRRACRLRSGGAGGGAPEQDDPGHGAGQASAAARRDGKHQQRPPRRETKLVRALPCLAYSAGVAWELAGSSRSECAICLAAFARGEAVRVLPRCGHGFHARCIDRWLAAARPTCPTCRQAPFDQTTALLQPAADGLEPAVVDVPLVRVVLVGDHVARLVEPSHTTRARVRY